jgi:hypothetical protein
MFFTSKSTSPFNLIHSLVQLDLLCPLVNCECTKCMLKARRPFPLRSFLTPDSNRNVALETESTPQAYLKQKRKFTVHHYIRELGSLTIIVRFMILFVFDSRDVAIVLGDFTLAFGWARKLFILVCIVFAISQLMIQRSFRALLNDHRNQVWLQSIDTSVSVDTRLAAKAFDVLRVFALIATKVFYPIVCVLACYHLYYYVSSSTRQLVIYSVSMLSSQYIMAYLSNFLVRRTNYIPFVFHELIQHHIRDVQLCNTMLSKALTGRQTPLVGRAARFRPRLVQTAIGRMHRHFIKIERQNHFWCSLLGTLYFNTLTSNALILLMAYFVQDPFMRYLVSNYAPIQLYSCALLLASSAANLSLEQRRETLNWVAAVPRLTTFKSQYRLFSLIEMLSSDRSGFFIFDIAPMDRSMIIPLVMGTISNSVLFVQLFAKF